MQRTLVRDQAVRMSWEEMLEHPIFDRVPSELPDYIAESFYNMQLLKGTFKSS